MEFNDTTKRALVIGVIVAILAVVCTIRLYDLQIVNGESYRLRADSNSVRTYTVKAPRGEMFDRNGNPIVENRVGYSIQLSDVDLSDEELNDNIIELVRLLREK